MIEVLGGAGMLGGGPRGLVQDMMDDLPSASPSDTDTEGGTTDEDADSPPRQGGVADPGAEEGEDPIGALLQAGLVIAPEDDEAAGGGVMAVRRGRDATSSGESSPSAGHGPPRQPLCEPPIGRSPGGQWRAAPAAGMRGLGSGMRPEFVHRGVVGDGMLTGPEPTTTGAGPSMETHGILYRSQYRGVSYDKKKRKWRVQIKVAALGKSGVSVGYFDTEESAARAYDRAAIGLLGPDASKSILNFSLGEYDTSAVPKLVGKTREEVKALLKNERAKLPRRRLSNRRRTSKYLGVGSSNRKNQWQARILYHGKVTHLGYYPTEEQAARVYDRVSISLHKDNAETNFPLAEYREELMKGHFNGMSREELQRALGVKPMNKSSRFRGVSKKKGKWEAKVMVNRKWAYRELFDTELEAAQAYDAAVWNLKPREARSYVNFKESCPPEVQAYLRALELEESGHSDALLAPVIKGEGPSTMTRSYSNTAPGVGSPIASLNPEWLRSMGGREEALQRYNSAPSPRNLQQMAGAAGSSILMSRNSQPNLAEAPATSPVDLLRLAHAIPSGRKAAMLPPPPPPQLPTPSAGNLGGIPQDHAPRSAMLRPVNQEGILARAAELQRRMGGMDRMSGGQEHPYVGQQNLGSAISEAMLMPAVEARHHSMPADLGRGPLFVRVGSETHLLQGMPGQQGQAQTQRSMSDAGVYLMLRQQDQVGDLSSQPDRLSSIHALANMQGQDPVHLGGRRLETSPFALAASLDQQQQQQPHGGDGRSQQSTGLESWNLGNVMFSDFQMPASHAGVSLPMMNLEQVQSGHGGTAVAIDLASGARHGMGEAAGHVKADPLLLAVGPSNVDRDVVMAGTGGMGQPVTPQGGRQQERYEYPQVRLEDVLVVDPRDPQVHMGNDVDMELVLRSMSEQASLHPMKGPTASATEAHMLSNRPLQLTNDEIMDELMAPPLSGGMMHRRLGR